MQRKNQLLAVLVAALLLGSAARIVGMTWGLPYQLQPDEPALFINAWERWDTGSAIISQQYPPGYLYVLVAQRAFITGVFGDDTPQVVYFFFARWNSILISLLILAVAYRLGRAMAGWQTGLAFALILTLEPVAALEVGWIIKVDNMAFLFALLALLTSVFAMQRRSWRWVGVSLVMGLVAALTKYNMGFVLLAPTFAALHLMLRRALLSFALMNLLVIGGLWAGWSFIHVYWGTEVTPLFYHCIEGEAPPEDLLPDRRIDVLPCGPFYAFQQYAGPFYTRSQFWDASVDDAFEHIMEVLRDDLTLPWILLGTAALSGALLMLGVGREREMAAILGAVLVPTVAVFAISGIAYPPRQYYVIILCAALSIALGLGTIARREPRLYAALLLVLIATFAPDALRDRRDLLKPDTRVVTADYFLENARQGETIVVEYDDVEFAEQYGGFPRPEGYFNIIEVNGLFELDMQRLFADQIYYVVADLRARGQNSFAVNEDSLPEEFDLLLDLDSDAYFGPARYVYRTFRPENAVEVTFGDVARLHGYDMRLEDNALTLTFYWQALAGDLPNYTLFVHLVDVGTGEAVIQRDAPPERHSSQWDQYEWVFDERVIPLDVPPGSYEVQIGWYESASLDRLPVDSDGVGFVTLTHLTLE